MSYGSVITKYKEMHRQSSLDEILALWNRSKSNLNVYVHSPFCPSICKFCYYKGKEFDFDRDYPLYRKYYYDYLPKTIKPFLPIIESRQIGNYFFGGGTPSLMKPEAMCFIFDMFPVFREVKSKTFEIHPAVWTENQLDILAEYNFNCCIIGIQSFDKSVLDRQGRLYATKEKIKDLAQKIKDRGMYLAIDIIYRMDTIDADEIFKRDLECLVDLDSDIISLQYNFNELREDENIGRFLELVFESPLTANYRWAKATRENPVTSIDKEKKKKALRYIKNNLSYEIYSTEIFRFLNTIDEGSKHFFKGAGYPSLIGFGSYQNCCKNTFSTIRADKFEVEYIEINNNWTPEHYITFNGDRLEVFNETLELMKKLKSLGIPPAEITVNIINDSIIEDDPYVLRKPYVMIGLEILWKERTPAVDEFLGRLKNIFQNIIEHSSSIIISEKRCLGLPVCWD